MTTNMPLCLTCQYFNDKEKLTNEGYVAICQAYPNGIPKEIFFEAYDHRKPFKGDHGITFKEKNNC